MLPCHYLELEKEKAKIHQKKKIIPKLTSEVRSMKSFIISFFFPGIEV